MSLSFDDRYLVTGGADSMIRIWDARDVRQLDVMKGHKDAVMV